MMEERRARVQRDRLLAGVDQVPVLLAGGRRLAEVEHAVLGVVDHLAPLRLELGDHLGKADAEIDIGAVGQVLRGAPCDLGVGQLVGHHFAPSRRRASSCCGFATWTTRSTKMPGVTTCSGSISPGATMRLAWTIVVLAAIAISGEKFRAALR